MKFILSLCIAACAAPAMAQEVMPCDWQSSARNVVEPWEDNSRTFANGDVRLINFDTIEPAVGFAYLMILSPPYDELGDRQCAVIGAESGVGFAGLDFDSLEAGYDPAVGLVFDLVVRGYDPETAKTPRKFLNVTLNQATGAIGAVVTADRN
jgi:hypothetical protein